MTDNLGAAIQAEMQSMTRDQLEAELAKFLARRAKQRDRATSNPEARKRYYEKVKNDPDWLAKRKVQAAKRKAKSDALIAYAKQTLPAERLKELGIV